MAGAACRGRAVLNEQVGSSSVPVYGADFPLQLCRHVDGYESPLAGSGNPSKKAVSETAKARAMP